MIENVTYEIYAATKMVVCKYYSSIKNMDNEEANLLFSRFGYFEKVARNTFLCPYDIDLLNDMKNVNQSNICNSGLAEKYNISESLLQEKYQEYHIFELEKLLSEGIYLDSEILKSFHFQDETFHKNI